MRISITTLLTVAGLFGCAAPLAGCAGDVAVGSSEKQLQVKTDGKATGDGDSCSWAGTTLRPADNCSSVPTPEGYGPYALGDDFASPDGCNECTCTERGIMCTVRECGGTSMAPPDSVECTLEAKICPDGSGVGRQGPNCEFAPCPGEESDPGNGCAVACTDDAKVCPDGSAVGRTGPNCEFEACPDEGGVVCTLEAMICPDGSYVGRTAPDCEFAPCPDEEVVCDLDAKICPDGSAVGRTGPDCEFAPCPDDIICTGDVKECSDGSYVSRTGPDCEFAPCPDEGVACDLDAKICPDGSAVGRTGPDCEFAPCPYDPCEGKSCGDSCMLCAPDDTDCAETAVLKACTAAGVCEAGVATCE